MVIFSSWTCAVSCVAVSSIAIGTMSWQCRKFVMSNNSRDFFFLLFIILHSLCLVTKLTCKTLSWNEKRTWFGSLQLKSVPCEFGFHPRCPRSLAFTGERKRVNWYIYIPMYISVLVFPILYFPCPWAIQFFVPNTKVHALHLWEIFEYDLHDILYKFYANARGL